MSHLICSHCGSIQSLEEDPDLESGATYSCKECKQSSILLILSPEDYVDVIQFLSYSKQDRVKQIEQLIELERRKGVIQDTKKFHKKLIAILTGQTTETGGI